jgi:hypothetical protein
VPVGPAQSRDILRGSGWGGSSLERREPVVKASHWLRQAIELFWGHMVYDPSAMTTTQYSSNSSEAPNRYIASGVGGAILGASTFGPPGAVLGALIGVAIASSVTTQSRKREAQQDDDSPLAS